MLSGGPDQSLEIALARAFRISTHNSPLGVKAMKLSAIVLGVLGTWLLVGGMKVLIGHSPGDVDFGPFSGVVSIFMGAFLGLLAWGKWTKKTWASGILRGLFWWW